MIAKAPSGIDWDAGNLAKCQAHGVSIEEIESLFRGSPRAAPDPEHSVAETRYIAIGRTAGGRPLFVAFTFRDREGPAARAPDQCPLHARQGGATLW